MEFSMNHLMLHLMNGGVRKMIPSQQELMVESMLYI